MEKEQIGSIIQILEIVREKPFMFINVKGLPIVNFLLGFNMACRTLGTIKTETPILEQLMLERGWDRTVLGSINKMKEQGLDDEGIIRELLTIEIEVWKQEYGLS